MNITYLYRRRSLEQYQYHHSRVHSQDGSKITAAYLDSSQPACTRSLVASYAFPNHIFVQIFSRPSSPSPISTRAFSQSQFHSYNNFTLHTITSGLSIPSPTHPLQSHPRHLSIITITQANDHHNTYHQHHGFRIPQIQSSIGCNLNSS